LGTASSDPPQSDPVLTWTAAQPQNPGVLDDAGPAQKDPSL